MGRLFWCSQLRTPVVSSISGGGHPVHVTALSMWANPWGPSRTASESIDPQSGIAKIRC
jgi:hypothetical protein